MIDRDGAGFRTEECERRLGCLRRHHKEPVPQGGRKSSTSDLLDVDGDGNRDMVLRFQIADT